MSGEQTKKLLYAGGIVMLSVLTSTAIRAQTNGRSDERALQISVDLTLLDVTVEDRSGKPVRNLRREDFKVYEDKVEQPISYFTTEESPVSWGLVLDRSASMQGMMEEVYAAAMHVIDEGTKQDEMFIMTFNNTIETVSKFTSDRRELANALFGLHAEGNTALYDAVESGLEYLKQGGHRKKVLVVITDGGDNKSRIRFSRLIDRVRESDMLIYTVGMFGDMAHNPIDVRLRMRPRDELKQLAEITGAYAHFPANPEKCREAMQRIAREVSEHYTVGYYPTNRAHDGKWRKINVAVTDSHGTNAKLVVRTRTGYYAVNER